MVAGMNVSVLASTVGSTCLDDATISGLRMLRSFTRVEQLAIGSNWIHRDVLEQSLRRQDVLQPDRSYTKSPHLAHSQMAATTGFSQLKAQHTQSREYGVATDESGMVFVVSFALGESEESPTLQYH